MTHYQPKSGQILFASGNYLFSKLIRTATKSSWSHVATIYEIPRLGGFFIAEAIESIGIRLVPYDSLFTSYRSGNPYHGDVYVGELQGDARYSIDRALTFSGKHLGKNYDYVENFKIALDITTGKRLGSNDDLFNCAEFVAAQFAAGGYNFSQAPPINTPKSIASDPNVKIIRQIL